MKLPLLLTGLFVSSALSAHESHSHTFMHMIEHFWLLLPLLPFLLFVGIKWVRRNKR